ncbi:hypothetical protein [Mycobacterium sp. ACS4331]|nr:hypothetical protein [Mycobacterium sp. ACS4331]
MTAMTVAWVFGPFLALVYAVLVLRGATLLGRFWERRHPSGGRR